MLKSSNYTNRGYKSYWSMYTSISNTSKQFKIGGKGYKMMKWREYEENQLEYKWKGKQNKLKRRKKEKKHRIYKEGLKLFSNYLLTVICNFI